MSRGRRSRKTDALGLTILLPYDFQRGAVGVVLITVQRAQRFFGAASEYAVPGEQLGFSSRLKLLPGFGFARKKLYAFPVMSRRVEAGRTIRLTGFLASVLLPRED